MTVGSLDWWGFVAIFVGTLVLTFWAGIEWCRFHHRQKGIEVDKLPWTDSLPPLPDTVPDWMEDEARGRR